jgi:hypothetical protein
MEGPGVNGVEIPGQAKKRSDGVTLLLIPLLIVIVWVLENYLVAGNPPLFEKATLPGLVIYTVLSCIVLGILVPIVLIRAAFLSGAVNMFQIGFRSLRRTVAAVSLTALAACVGFVLLSLSGQGPDRVTSAALFILLLPTAIAAVLICWVLVGTHVQAYVRSGGVIISVFTGVLMTGLVFAVSMSALFARAGLQELFAGFFAFGCAAAVFFFAVRDIYATIIVTTTGLVVLLNSRIDQAYLAPFNPVVACCAILAIGVLVGVHGYFSRHYKTVKFPGK